MVRVAPVILAAVAALGATAHAQESIPESKLKPLRDATVYIRSGIGPDKGTGSGFLIRKDGDIGFIVTNAHVAQTPQCEVIFFPGTEREAMVRGRIVALDTTEDLAVLRVEMKELPAPLDVAVRPAIRETSRVTILGFPFGGILQSGRRHPTATITLGSVSSLEGELGWIQIDGSVDPGNSGGPVVDQTGALVGVTVAKILGTRISFAIPSSQVQRMLAGRVSHVLMTPGAQKSRSIRMRIFGGLLDPLENVTEATLLFLPLPADAAIDLRSEKGPVLPGMTERSLSRGQTGYEADFELTSETGQDVVYVYQARYRRKDKTVLYTSPRQIRAEFSKTEAPKKDKDDWIDGNSPKEAPEKKTPPAPPPESAPAEPSGPAPKPEAIGASAAGSPQSRDSWTLRAMNMAGDTHFTAPAYWSPDGTQAWLKGSKGTIHRISLSELIEERRLTAMGRADSLGPTKDGLAVRIIPATGPSEVWLLDRTSLEVKTRVVPPAATRMISNPDSTQVYVVTQGGGELRGIDLATGRGTFAVKTGDFRDQGRRHPASSFLNTWTFSTVTPDGQFLLVPERSLHRFSLAPSGIPAAAESGPPVLRDNAQLIVSNDSKYVAVYCHDSQSLDGFPRAGLCVFKIDDFRKPVAHVAVDGTFLAFDKAAGRVYVTDPAGVAACNPTGAIQERFPLPRRGSAVYGMSVHPEGRKGFLFGSDGTFWFEMAK